MRIKLFFYSSKINQKHKFFQISHATDILNDMYFMYVEFDSCE